jgi:hypothetical protein
MGIDTTSLNDTVLALTKRTSSFGTTDTEPVDYLPDDLGSLSPMFSLARDFPRPVSYMPVKRAAEKLNGLQSSLPDAAVVSLS